MALARRLKLAYATAPVTEDSMTAFLEAGQAVIDANYARNYPSQTPPKLEADPRGQRYIRVWSTEPHTRSAWAFIERETGLIFKPASYKAPAKHARGTIHTERHGGEFVGPYGPAYLR
jgi:hypothetical protein